MRAWLDYIRAARTGRVAAAAVSPRHGGTAHAHLRAWVLGSCPSTTAARPARRPAPCSAPARMSWRRATLASLLMGWMTRHATAQVSPTVTLVPDTTAQPAPRKQTTELNLVPLLGGNSD